MLQDNDIKEALSIAYIQAVCGMAGYIYGEDSKDYGFDITVKDIIRRDSGKYCPSGYNIDIQVKASTRCTLTKSHIKYSLRNKNFNDLRDPNAGTQRILVVLMLPEDRDSWLTQDVNSLMVKKCAYWICLKGKERKDNEDSSTTLEIPTENIFNIDQLNNLIAQVKNGGEINDL